jgi:hypothetical protein
LRVSVYPLVLVFTNTLYISESFNLSKDHVLCGLLGSVHLSTACAMSLQYFITGCTVLPTSCSPPCRPCTSSS